jgi:hypothetical protein
MTVDCLEGKVLITPNILGRTNLNIRHEKALDVSHF